MFSIGEHQQHGGRLKRRTRIQHSVWLHSILALTLNGALVWPNNMGLAPAPLRRHWIARRVA